MAGTTRPYLFCVALESSSHMQPKDVSRLSQVLESGEELLPQPLPGLSQHGAKKLPAPAKELPAERCREFLAKILKSK
jgi:hypothetical protein